MPKIHKKSRFKELSTHPKILLPEQSKRGTELMRRDQEGAQVCFQKNIPAIMEL